MIYRVSPRGLLIENNSVLFIEYHNMDNERYYSLPGGGQDISVDLAQTLKKEFMEEVGLEIHVGDVLLVREFIISQPREDLWTKGIHQIEIIFDCKKSDPHGEISIVKPDHGMTGIKWIPIDEIKNYNVFPTPDIIDLVKDRRVHYVVSKS